MNETRTPATDAILSALRRNNRVEFYNPTNTTLSVLRQALEIDYTIQPDAPYADLLFALAAEASWGKGNDARDICSMYGDLIELLSMAGIADARASRDEGGGA